MKPPTHVPPPKKVVKEVKKEENIFAIDNKQSTEEENLFDIDNKQSNEAENIFDMDNKQSNEAENIFDMPKKQKFTQPKTSNEVKPKNNYNTHSKMKNKSGKDLFNFADEEEDIFSKKNGVSSIFDTDDNDKGNKDNAASSIFD